VGVEVLVDKKRADLLDSAIDVLIALEEEYANEAWSERSIDFPDPYKNPAWYKARETIALHRPDYAEVEWNWWA